MGKIKKFGTFAGVFTPSVLTILGVIMYMRLSWVVGQAGIIGTIGIIIIAHIISVTTGLSISSVATDKKIKTGGIYYMLSRSLGLPMGGAIGIALFVGTALSISLYIIGFVESFLNIEAISVFFNLPPSINSYRIAGSAVLIILTILALISTSLVIKSQYLILSAIALSLVSVFVGFGMHPELIPDTPALLPQPNGENLSTVFAIFFPAVTGFTAGVAMSGDLINPRKNIPAGTLWAIAVGFVIYLLLTITFGIYIDRTNLISNENVILEVAWLPQLVIAGIWGATLSSALGGILGGPRILQALSQDGVTPKIFGKGYGPSLEPRAALMLIFLIAEGGILIGNLNVIAGIVTMFYLASYGFINLAYVLESWAGPDFRPSFKVSKIFGITGFVFAFAVMFQLDMLSMIMAFIIIGAIFFVLERKQLKLDNGDVWKSVWISVVRRGLHILDHNSIEDRNWLPNIILFSGGDKKRAHILEFGNSLVGKYGFLSNFDLTEDPDVDVLFPKYRQSIPDKDNKIPGLFTRRQDCKNIYDGIEMIVRTYGFSGIEPNTIVMGWGRQSKEPARFVKLIQTINRLDYNILLLDYDKQKGYGDYKRIDIWWRGAGNNGNFALTLAKFMLTSQQWENAQIRLMIVSKEYSKTHYIYRQANDILDSMRLNAEVIVVNNEVEQRPFYEIIRTESKKTDLVFLGIPQINKGEEDDFVEKTSKLLQEIGTVVLLRAATVFKELNLGINISQQSVISASHNFDLEEKIAQNILESRHPKLNEAITESFKEIIDIHESTISTITFKEFDIFLMMFQELKNNLDDIFKSEEFSEKLKNQYECNKYISEVQEKLVNNANTQIEKFQTDAIPELQEMMVEILLEYKKKRDTFIKENHGKLVLHFDKEEFTEDYRKSLKYFDGSAFIRANIGLEPLKRSKMQKKIIRPMLFELIELEIEHIRIEGLKVLYKYGEYLKFILLQLSKLKNARHHNASVEELLTQTCEICENKYNQLETETKHIVTEVSENRRIILTMILNEFIQNTSTPYTFYEYQEKMKKISSPKYIEKKIDEVYNLMFEGKIKYTSYIKLKNTTALYRRTMTDAITNLVNNIQNIQKIPYKFWEQEAKKIQETGDQIIAKFPKSVEIMNRTSTNSAFNEDFTQPTLIQLQTQNIISNIQDTEIIAKFKKITEYPIVQNNNSKEYYTNELNKIKEAITKIDTRRITMQHENKE